MTAESFPKLIEKGFGGSSVTESYQEHFCNIIKFIKELHLFVLFSSFAPSLV